MANMNMADSWTTERRLVEHLAMQLVKGRLGLFLGAGVSSSFNLPDWTTLVTRMHDDAGEAPPKDGFDPTMKADVLRSARFKEAAAFKEAVRKALYRDAKLDFASISQSRLLSSIGSLVMASRRGAAAKVITLNFDDVLERYLEFHGFTTATVHSGRHWAQNEDVVIYHPHGFLSFDQAEESDDLVLGTTSFHHVMTSALWRPVIETALRQHTFLYVGLSGQDMHLHSHWADLKEFHAISSERIRYHGVRFDVSGSEGDVALLTEKWGIHTHVLASWDELPGFLYSICQKARSIRMKSG